MLRTIEMAMEAGNLQVIGQVERRGGLAFLTDRDIKAICRMCRLQKVEKSAEQLAYEEYVQLDAIREGISKELSQDGEGSYNNWEGNYYNVLSEEDRSRLSARLESVNEEIKKVLPLAQAWYDFTGNSNHHVLV